MEVSCQYLDDAHQCTRNYLCTQMLDHAAALQVRDGIGAQQLALALQASFLGESMDLAHTHGIPPESKKLLKQFVVESQKKESIKLAFAFAYTVVLIGVAYLLSLLPVGWGVGGAGAYFT